MSESSPLNLHFILFYYKHGQPKTRMLGEALYTEEEDDDPKEGLFAEAAPFINYDGDKHDVVLVFDCGSDANGDYHASGLCMTSYFAEHARRGQPMWKTLALTEHDPVRQHKLFVYFRQALLEYQQRQENVVVALKKQ